MSASIPHTPVRRPVRMPFRVLAALVGMLGVVAVVGTPFLIWRGAHVITAGDILMLPLMAWGIRLMFHAVAHGNSPGSANCWPFASLGVWNCYIYLLLAYWMFKP
jgi:hypothetical protein